MRKSKFISGLIAVVLTVTAVFSGMTVQAASTAVQGDEFVTKVEDSDTTTSDELFKICYSDGWNAESGYHTLFSNGDDHYSAVRGAYFEMTFIGHKVELIASLNRVHGVYDVYIDDALVGEADSTTAGATIHQQVIFTSKELDEGEHTLKVVLKNGHENIQIDCVKVYHDEIVASSITLSDTRIRLESGSDRKVDAIVYPGVASNVTVEWESADESIATVNENGVITAVSTVEAETVVTAVIAGTELSADVQVIVVPVAAYLSASVGDVNRLETQEDYQELKGLYQDTWTDVAWKGDELISKIVVCTRDTAVHNAEVTVSDFVSEDGILTADQVDVKWLKEVQANIGRGNAYAPVKAFPDVIYKGGKMDVPAGKVMFSWITIHVPKDAEAGTYTGAVTVTADELDKPYIFDYTFEVLDLVQPETDEEGTQIQIWQHPFSVANYYGVAQKDYFTEEHFKYMRASMEEYKALGGKDIVANIVEEAWNHQSYYGDPSMVKWTKNSDGTFTFDYTWYDAWIEFLIECGVLDPENGEGQIKCYSIVPWNNQIAYYDEALGRTIAQSYTPGTSDWREIWTTFLTDFMEHSKTKGWFDITYISMDERGMDQLEPAVELLNGLTDENGDSFKVSSAFNYSSQADYTFMDKIDDISINLGYISNTSDKLRDMSAHRRELGLMTTVYTCTGNYPGNFTISDPADNYWVMWYSLTHNTDGFMRWAWDNWVADPLTDVTYKYWEPGDGWFIYPMEKDVTGNVDYYYSTPRYEMLKKGVRDIDKAKYLMNCSDELNAEVKELVLSLKQPRSGNSYGSAVAASEADRELVFSETARMRDGIMGIAERYISGNVEPTVTPEPTVGPEPTTTPTPTETPGRFLFDDVQDADEFYYAPVYWAYDNEITKGITVSQFQPYAGCTRGQIITFIWRAENRPSVTNAECKFTDVDEKQFYYEPMLWGVESGVITGYSDSIFAPDDICTRGQIVTMIWRAMDKPKVANQEHAFTDVDASQFYYEPMLWAVEKEITKGTTATTFEPDKSVNRGETVTFLYRAYK